MLLIWLHGILLAHQNPVKRIYEDLVEAGFQPVAGKLLQSTLRCPLRNVLWWCGAEVPAGAGKVVTLVELEDTLFLSGTALAGW